MALQNLFSKRRTFSTNSYSYTDITNINKEHHSMEGKIQRPWPCYHMSAPTSQAGRSSEMLKPSRASECMHGQGHLGASLARMHLFLKEKKKHLSRLRWKRRSCQPASRPVSQTPGSVGTSDTGCQRSGKPDPLSRPFKDLILRPSIRRIQQDYWKKYPHLCMCMWVSMMGNPWWRPSVTRDSAHAPPFPLTSLEHGKKMK